MEYAIGILLLLSFIGLAIYCVKGQNLMIGFLVMAFLWTILPLIGNALFAHGIINNPDFLANNPIALTSIIAGEDGKGGLLATINGIFQSAPEGWGTTLVNVFWGAWFGRVLMDTGIAATIIRKTVELGGDRPVVTISLLNIVTALIFTSMTGAGPVIAIGVIVLPILFSLGIPKAIAMFSFMGAVAAGIYMNPVNFAQYRAFFVEATDKTGMFEYSEYTMTWGVWAALAALVITTIFTAVYLKMNKPVHAWAAQVERPDEQKNAPAISLIAPLLPVAGAIFLKLSVILGFVIAGFFSLWICGRLKGGFKKSCALVNKLFHDGVVDTAPLVGFLLVLPMFNKAAELAAPYFKAIVGGIIPQSTFAISILFAVMAVFGLFRGPMTLVGCGAATLGVVKTMGFNFNFLYACFAIPTITMNIGSCITQSWVAWGLAYSKVEGKDFLKLSIPSGWTVSVALYAITYLILG